MPRPLHLLAFDTSTDVLSVAVAVGDAVWAHQSPGSALASAGLIPAVRRLLADAGTSLGALDAVVFGNGPGSFTGLRTACAVAQGLAFGAGVPVLPVNTLLAVAEDARTQHGAGRVVATLDARMGEVYWAHYRHDGVRWHGTADGFGLAAPESVPVPDGWAVAGNAAAAYGERIAPGVPRFASLPTAGALLRVAPALLAAGGAMPAALALPRYVRDKVAQTTAERAAVRAAAEQVA